MWIGMLSLGELKSACSAKSWTFLLHLFCLLHASLELGTEGKKREIKKLQVLRVFSGFSAWENLGDFRGMEGCMDIYLTIAELAGMLKLSEQTIRRYVLNRAIPYRKIRKAVRFRLSEIERWVDGGCMADCAGRCEEAGGGLFQDAAGFPSAGESLAEGGGSGEQEGQADG
jgi:excisionase family DNA binding protein